MECCDKSEERLGKHQSYLLRCVLFGFGIEIIWLLFLMMFGRGTYDLVRMLMPISLTTFWRMNFLGIVVIEVLVVIFYLVPFLATWCMRKQCQKTTGKA